MSAIKKKSRNTKKKLSFKKQNKKIFRETEPLLSVFMWGVNYSYAQLRGFQMPEILMPDDFKAYTKVKIDNQNFKKDVLPSHYKVKEYCPLVFKNIRDRFHVTDESYLRSITNGLEPYDCQSGKSTAKFYMTSDCRYLLKTVDNEDIADLHNILTDYHRHIVETKGNTLLPHLLGMYRLTVEDKENYILVMRNIFNSKFKIHTKYDIKGSTVDRAASQKEKEKDTPTFKDNDFLSDNRSIQIDAEARDEFMRKLNYDIKFLNALKLMDYSLLIGIHDVDKAENEIAVALVEKSDTDTDNFSPEDTEDTDDDQLNNTAPTPPDSPTRLSSTQSYGLFGIPSVDKRQVYFMAFIDILTHYGLKKRSANVAKSVKYPDQEISTVKPEQYSKRFVEFISKITKP